MAILSHPDFVAVRHSTRWVEDRLDLSGLSSPGEVPEPEPDEPERVLREVTAEVDGRLYRVKLWVPAADASSGGTSTVRQPARRARRSAPAVTGSGTVTVPMQGTIVRVLVAVGDEVELGQTICVLEAMKMENAIAADKNGTVREIRVTEGASVGGGDVVAIIE